MPSPSRPQPIFHIATRADWEAARASGTYTTSTHGRSLEEEGFIHAARRDQVGEVFRRHYRGVRVPLVLLTIDPARLRAEVREEQVGEETYPHVHGPVETAAVVDVRPLDRRGGTESVASLFAREMAGRMAVALVVMVTAAAGAAVATTVSEADWAPLAGLVAGASLGVTLVVVRRVLRRP